MPGAKADQPRNGQGRFERTLVEVERDHRAAELRSAGFTPKQIAAELGVCLATAYRAIEAGLVMVPTESVVALTRLEILKLDRRERRLVAILGAEYVKTDNGRVMVYDGKPLVDPMPNIAASNALDRVAVRRARLCGLDEPAKIRVSHVTESELDVQIAELLAQLPPEEAEGLLTEFG